MMKILLLLLTAVVVGYCAGPYSYFGTVEPLQYRDSVAKLNSLIACLLKLSPCQGLDANIQGRLAEMIEFSCASCDYNERAVIHDLASLIAQKHPKILKSILRRYDFESEYSKAFLRAINTFPSKANIPNIPNLYTNSYYVHSNKN